MIGPLAFNPNGVVGTASAGPLTTNTSPNYALPPDMLPSNKSMVPGHGCAGTKQNVISAKGIFEPYNKMHGGNKKLSTHEFIVPDLLVNGIAGPYSGYSHKYVNNPGPECRSTNIPRVGGKRKLNRTKRVLKKKKKRTMKKKHNRMRGGYGCGCGRTCRRSCGCNRRVMSKTRSSSKKSRKNKRRSRRVTRGGGGEQPFSNRPISFGYAIDTTKLPTELSGLANRPQIKIYDNCGKYSRN